MLSVSIIAALLFSERSFGDPAQTDQSPQLAADNLSGQNPEKIAPPTPREVPVQGRVFDADQKAVADAEIAVVAMSLRPKSDIQFGATQTELLGTSKTDSPGQFQLLVRPTSSPNDIALTVIASHLGSTVDWQSFDVGQEKYQTELHLNPELHLQGRAVDAQGNPAGHVKIFIVDMRKTNPRTDNTYIFNGQVPKGMSSWPAVSVTDEQGHFVLQGIGPEISVEADDERFARQRWTLSSNSILGSNPAVALKLSPPRVINGSVRTGDTNTPSTNAAIALTTWSDGGQFLGAVVGQTDSEGIFRLRPYLGDKVEIRIRSLNETYKVLSRKIPWPEGTVTQMAKLSLQPAVVASPNDMRVPSAVAMGVEPTPDTTTAPRKLEPIAERLSGRLYSCARFKADSSKEDQTQCIISIDPNTGQWSKITAGGWSSLRVSPDGKMLALLASSAVSDHPGLWVCEMKSPTQPKKVFLGKVINAVWTANAKSLIVNVSAPAQQDYHGEEYWGTETEKWQIGADGSHPIRLQLPPLHEAFDCSPDGKWIATYWDTHSENGAHLYLIHSDGTELKQITEPGFRYSWYPRFSPDGHKMLFKRLDPATHQASIGTIQCDDAKEQTIFSGNRPWPEIACWLEDGKYIAILAFVSDRDHDSRLIISDANGQRIREIKLANVRQVNLNGIDWAIAPQPKRAPCSFR